MKPVQPILVILGLGDDQKPRAARFDPAQAEVVRKAAKAMGLRVGFPKTDEAKALAVRLVPGRLYATGKGLVPLVKAATYQELLAKLELEPKAEDGPDQAKPASAPAAAGAAAKASASGAAAASDPWAALKVGDKVIVPERRPAEEGWWPCVITAASKDGRTLTLRWLDNPKQPPITLKRQAVALLYPA